MTVAAFDNETEFCALIEGLTEDLYRRRERGGLQQNGRLIRDAMARGVRVDRLVEEIELPPNMAVVTWKANDSIQSDNA